MSDVRGCSAAVAERAGVFEVAGWEVALLGAREVLVAGLVLGSWTGFFFFRAFRSCRVAVDSNWG